jgi:hypothetical protein
VQYVTSRLQWFLKRQKHPIITWMASLKSSSDEPWFSKLYSDHGGLLNTRREIKKAVFKSFDTAIEGCCDSFKKIFLQLLSSIYNNPNNFLAK